jgi:asparagine synthase (glutamine-hydrolysing)
MCGICGLVTVNGPPDRAAVDGMREALVHRGPDEGSTDVFERCALGHQRLRVLDLETGQQPVANESGDVVAVFNGEIYNFRELRDELAKRGHVVPGTGDTPVIPHLYEELGPRFPERLAGMFAVALWDRTRDRLVLARDRLGKKPLLWTRLPDGTFAFASELKAFLRLPGHRRELDREALDAYLALQYVPGARTALRGIEKVPPGHVLVVEDAATRVERYWQLELREAASSDDEWLERVRAAVRGAVSRRLLADVPLGALLSGGIDSSVVVALMAEASPRAVRTFTVGFRDERYDERLYARELADRYGTDHVEVELDVDAAATLPRLAEALDEPLGDDAALPLFLISEEARRHVTVALTGDGGDEAFAGYERYAAHALAARVPAAAGRAAARLLRVLPSARREPRAPVFRAARFFEVAAAPAAERYGRLVEVFPREARSDLWAADARPTGELLGAPLLSVITELQRLDIGTYLPGDLLLKADLVSMAHSLELRSPFLDHDVMALGLALPEHLKTRGREGKLPPRIARRRKRGLGVPLARWFRGQLRPIAHEVLLDRRARERGLFRDQAVRTLVDEHAAGRADHGHRLWCLLMLELWLRAYVER